MNCAFAKPSSGKKENCRWNCPNSSHSTKLPIPRNQNKNTVKKKYSMYNIEGIKLSSEDLVMLSRRNNYIFSDLGKAFDTNEG